MLCYANYTVTLAKAVDLKQLSTTDYFLTPLSTWRKKRWPAINLDKKFAHPMQRLFWQHQCQNWYYTDSKARACLFLSNFCSGIHRKPCCIPGTHVHHRHETLLWIEKHAVAGGNGKAGKISTRAKNLVRERNFAASNTKHRLWYSTDSTTRFHMATKHGTHLYLHECSSYFTVCIFYLGIYYRGKNGVVKKVLSIYVISRIFAFQFIWELFILWSSFSGTVVAPSPRRSTTGEGVAKRGTLIPAMLTQRGFSSTLNARR